MTPEDCLFVYFVVTQENQLWFQPKGSYTCSAK
jgi:hypothetical protein